MSKKETTKLLHSGHKPEDYYGVVNPPIVRTSTMIYSTLEAYEDPEDLIADLDQAFKVFKLGR